jgi:hypothetical protein
VASRTSIASVMLESKVKAILGDPVGSGGRVGLGGTVGLGSPIGPWVTADGSVGDPADDVCS